MIVDVLYEASIVNGSNRTNFIWRFVELLGSMRSKNDQANLHVLPKTISYCARMILEGPTHPGVRACR